MISETIKTNAPSCTVEMWAQQVPGGPGRRMGRDAAGSLQTKRPLSRVISGYLGMMPTCTRAGTLQRREGAARGGSELPFWTRVSLGRQEMDTLVWDRERVFHRGTQDLHLKAQQVRSWPWGPHVPPTLKITTFPLIWLKIIPLPLKWVDIFQRTEYQFGIGDRGDLSFLKNKVLGVWSLEIYERCGIFIKRYKCFNYRILETEGKNTFPKFFPFFKSITKSLTGMAYVWHMLFGIWYTSYQ